MQYDIFIQDTKVGTIEAENTGNALAVVAKKISSGEYAAPDPNSPKNIRIEPSDAWSIDQWNTSSMVHKSIYWYDNIVILY